MSWTGETDRRRHKRAAIRIRSEFGDPKSPTRIETVDFSAGGFSCFMDHAIQPLTKLALQFEFPSFGDSRGRALGCEAIVVRCDKRTSLGPGWMMAAAFTGLSPEDRQFLARYVAWHETVMAPPDSDELDAFGMEESQEFEG